MSVQRVPGHAATFEVDSSRLRCSNSTSGCSFNSVSPIHIEGDSCPKCQAGFLEREKSRVDLATLQCGCEDATVGKTARKSKGVDKVERWRQRIFCKHVRQTVFHLQTEENDLLEVLAGLPGQTQENVP